MLNFNRSIKMLVFRSFSESVVTSLSGQKSEKEQNFEVPESFVELYRTPSKSTGCNVARPAVPKRPRKVVEREPPERRVMRRSLVQNSDSRANKCLFPPLATSTLMNSHNSKVTFSQVYGAYWSPLLGLLT